MAPGISLFSKHTSTWNCLSITHSQHSTTKHFLHICITDLKEFTMKATPSSLFSYLISLRDHVIYRFFLSCKIDNLQYKNLDIFNILAQNIHCGYTLEPPRRLPRRFYRVPTMYVLDQKKKIRYTPANLNFTM